MSDSDSQSEETASEEAESASQEAPNESMQQAESSGGASVSDFVTEAEQEIIKEWTIYVTGMFAALGLAIGINYNIQDQWDHGLLSGSGAGPGLGALGPSMSFLTVFLLGIVGSVVLGVVIARNVDNEQYTGYKVGAVTSIIGLPVLVLLSGLLLAQSVDNVDLEFVNTLVSGLGAGIAAAIGAAISIYLTEEQAPDAVRQ